MALSNEKDGRQVSGRGKGFGAERRVDRSVGLVQRTTLFDSAGRSYAQPRRPLLPANGAQRTLPRTVGVLLRDEPI